MCFIQPNQELNGSYGLKVQLLGLCWEGSHSSPSWALPSQISGEKKSGREFASIYLQQTVKCLINLYLLFRCHLTVTSSGKLARTPKTRSDPLLYVPEQPALLHHIYHVDNYFQSLPLDCPPKEASTPFILQHTE